MRCPLAALPLLREDGLPEPPMVLARQMRARVEGLDAAAVDTVELEHLRSALADLSDAISKRYFLQDENPVAKDAGRFLA